MAVLPPAAPSWCFSQLTFTTRRWVLTAARRLHRVWLQGEVGLDVLSFGHGHLLLSVLVPRRSDAHDVVTWRRHVERIGAVVRVGFRGFPFAKADLRAKGMASIIGHRAQHTARAGRDLDGFVERAGIGIISIPLVLAHELRLIPEGSRVLTLQCGRIVVGKRISVELPLFGVLADLGGTASEGEQACHESVAQPPATVKAQTGIA